MDVVGFLGLNECADMKSTVGGHLSLVVSTQNVDVGMVSAELHTSDVDSVCRLPSLECLCSLQVIYG